MFTILRRFTIVLATLLFSAFSASASWAQITTLGYNVSRPIPGAGHGYIHLLSETVNPANGSLNINIQLPTPRGRGLSLPVSIIYNSGSAHHMVSGTPGFGQYEPSSYMTLTNGGWGDSLPYATAVFWAVGMPAASRNSNATCSFSDGYNFYDPSGGSHALGLAAVAPLHPGSGGPINKDYCASAGVSHAITGGDDRIKGQALAICDGFSTDPSYCQYAEPPFTATDKDGTVYTFGWNGGTVNPSPKAPAVTVFLYPNTIEDRNGNKINVTGTPRNNTSLTDTLGRILVSKTYSSGNPTTYTVGGLTYKVAYTTSSANYSSPSQQVNVEAVGCNVNLTIPATQENGYLPVDTGTAPVVSSITLPNGRQYTFHYGGNPYGMVDEIDYPDGGWVKYTWELPTDMSDIVSFNGLEIGGPTGTPSGSCSYQYKTPVVATREVGFGGSSTPAQSQVFTYTTTWDPSNKTVWTQKTTTTATTDNVTGKTSKTVYTYSSVIAPLAPNARNQVPPQIPVEQSVKYYDWGSSTLLKTVTESWSDPYKMTSQQTSLNGGPNSQIVYQYDGAADVVTEKDEYDYGATSQTRTTIYQYQNFGPVPTNPPNPDGGNSFSGKILDRPCQVITYAGTTSGTREAETDYYYDGTSTLCGYGTTNLAGVSGLVAGTHDETQFGPTSTNSRGNVTKVVQWSNTGASPTTTYTYDETGQVLSKTDACGNATCADMTYGSDHTTTYSYADNYSSGTPSGNTNAYLTKITYPSTGNGVAHVEKFSYRFQDGQLSSSTDENNQTTTYSYADPLNRITETVLPTTVDGTTGNSGAGSIVYTYNDAAPSPSVTTSRLMSTSGQTETTVAIRDGMGHVVRTETTTDPAGTDYVDTTYNGEGNAASVSNPYRSGDTKYSTLYSYDALNRKIQQTQQDGSSLTWSFNGNVTDSYDETGRHWQRTTDALGRLTQVKEPNGSDNPTIETDYQYDALNNLTRVDQWGGPSGSSGDRVRSFVYDSLSRLTSATNPESGTTGYTYDSNGNVSTKTDARNVTINYSYDTLNRKVAETAPGINNQYNYDTTGTSTQNGVGRLLWASNMSNADEVFSYDAMGRLNWQSSWTPSNPNHTGIITQAQYDLAGNPVSVTYPDGRNVTDSYNGAGQLTQIQFANWNGSSVNYNYLASATYAADGSPASLTYGNGAIESDQRNSRLQPYESAVQTAAGGLNETVYDKHYCYGPSDTRSCTNLGKDNGDILSVLDMLTNNRSQGFSYDNLNRVTAFNTGDNTMVQSFAYDPWGNMTQSGTQSFQVQYGANNQIATSGFDYDAAGNLTQTDIGVTETYAYDSLGQITSYHNGGATYTYDAIGQRVRKDSGGSWTEYIDWNGQPLAEKNADGSWSDYIYGDGRRIARADSYDERIHISGTSTKTGSYAAWYLPFADYVIKSGDRISWRQYQTATGGGIGISFTDGSNTNWSTKDTSGQEMNNDSTVGAWHERTVDLTPFAGKTANKLWVASSAATPAGSWNIWYGEIAIYSADGTVTTIYERTPGEGFSYWTGGGETNTAAIVERTNTATDAEQPGNTTTYYVGDQIGSARMQIAAGGWPVSVDDYYPFGVEQAAPADVNHYKFTGKERDAETGLDYFGARYFSSIMGRFMSPDWSKNPEGVPYADYTNPQSLNLYSYMRNNPLGARDVDGHGGPTTCYSANVINYAASGYGISQVSYNLAMTCQGLPDQQQRFKTQALQFLGRHRKAVKGVSRAIIIGTAISGLFDAGTSEAALPEEVAGEAALETAVDAEAEGAVVDANKLSHVFDNSQHALGDLVGKFGGSQEQAFNAIQSATETAVQQRGLSGVFETTVNVAGETVTVRGAVVDGVVKIGTAFK